MPSGVVRPPRHGGDSVLYRGLSASVGYYGSQKWEFEQSLRDIRQAGRLLEIGCGRGEFLLRVRERAESVEGIEVNPDAAQAARANGIPVHEGRFEDLAAAVTSTYDTVCVFQVLEHMPLPASVLRTFCRLLRSGGTLVLGLPNADNYLRWGFHALDAPSHHVTRWSDTTLRRLKAMFPLDLLRVACEPMPRDCIDRWVDDCTGWLSGRLHAPFLTRPGVRRFLTRALDRSGAYRSLRGQTLYAAFRRR